jgi:branched-chain amino acid transport system permease protein
MDLSKINWKQLASQSGIPLLILVVLCFLPLYGWAYGVTLFTYFLLYIILTVSWVIFSGTTGYISLATAAFYGLGIYTAAIYYPSLGNHLPLIVVVLIGAAASFIVAFIVGAITLRLRGIYFAMFTFGLVLLIQEVIKWIEVDFNHRYLRTILIVSNETIYYYLLGIAVVTIIAAYLIKRSKFGLALQSIGENEEAAVHMGINVTMVKILTFAVSAIFMGAAGVIMATRLTTVDPDQAFNAFMSFKPALMAIFGGMMNFYGPVIGAVIFSYMEEVLSTAHWFGIGWGDFYKIIFGVILVATILFLPNGLMGLIQNLWRRIKGVRRASAGG